jgi:hypothetical protein
MKLISDKTSLPDLRRLFGLVDGNVKIIWTGKKVALRHFILQLERQDKIKKFDDEAKYKTVAQLFTLEKDPDYDLEKLGSNNGKYAKVEDLKKLFRNL